MAITFITVICSGLKHVFELRPNTEKNEERGLSRTFLDVFMGVKYVATMAFHLPCINGVQAKL